MHHKLQCVFNQAESDRNAVFELLKTVPEEIFTQQCNHQWSPSQIIAHLILSENLSLQYMNKKYLGINESGRTGLGEDLKFALLKISQRLPLKFKAPKVLAESQPETLPFHELKSKWDASRNNLKTFLERFDDAQLSRKVYKHPFAGKLNIIQGLSFMREHVLHHLPQIKSRIK